MSIHSVIAIVTACVLSGCVAATVNTSTLAIKAADRDELRLRADAGDSDAQYLLGKSYCCMGPGFDTQTATAWLCRAARQNNADAMFELGRIYDGDVSRTPAPGQKLRRALSAKRSEAHAYLWLSRASALGHREAEARLRNMEASIGDESRALALSLGSDERGVACEYDDVFPD